MTGPTHPSPRLPASKKKKNNNTGCLIVLGVMLAASLCVLIAIAVGLNSFSKTEEGKQAVGIVSEMWRVYSNGQDAPGVDELKAIGCSEAMVMELSGFIELLDEAAPDDGRLNEDDLGWTMITCTTSSKDVDCEAVKAAYLSAVPSPPGPYLVHVTFQAYLVHKEEKCQQAYAVDGTEIDLSGDEPAF